MYSRAYRVGRNIIHDDDLLNKNNQLSIFEVDDPFRVFFFFCYLFFVCLNQIVKKYEPSSQPPLRNNIPFVILTFDRSLRSFLFLSFFFPFCFLLVRSSVCLFVWFFFFPFLFSFRFFRYASINQTITLVSPFSRGRRKECYREEIYRGRSHIHALSVFT